MRNVVSLCALLTLAVGCNRAADFSSGSGVKSLASVEDEIPTDETTNQDETCLLGKSCPTDTVPEECIVEEGEALPKGCPTPEETTDTDTTTDEEIPVDTTDDVTTPDDETTPDLDTPIDEDTPDQCVAKGDYDCEDDSTNEEGPNQNGPNQN
ncbi:MAG: hypothetical protein AB7T49_12225 [Oligoflexales bacterium]